LPLEDCRLGVVRPLGSFVGPWFSRGVDGRGGGCFGCLMTWAMGFDGLLLGLDGVGGVSWCVRGWGDWDGVDVALVLRRWAGGLVTRLPVQGRGLFRITTEMVISAATL